MEIIRSKILRKKKPENNGNPENDGKIKTWIIQSRRYQEDNYNLFGDRLWDLIEDEDLLKHKIGFALFGIPASENPTDDFNYSNEQNKIIDSVKSRIIALQENIKPPGTKTISIHIACIYIYLYLKGNEQTAVDILFRIPKDNEKKEHQFIDSNCRIYNGWIDYLKNNKLPKCYMCYPLNGIYSAKDNLVEFDYCESPACKLTKVVLNKLDITSKLISVGAVGVTVASLALPVTTPFVIGTTLALVSSSYDVTRSASALIDKSKHQENLSLKDPASRTAWLDLATNAAGVLTFGSTAIASKLVKGEAIASRTCLIALRLLRFSSTAANGISLLNCLLTIVSKFLRGTLTKCDVVYFKEACLFFLNATVSYKLANMLIEDAAVNGTTKLFSAAKNSGYKLVKQVMNFTDSNYFLVKWLVMGSLSSYVPNSIGSDELGKLTEGLFRQLKDLKSGNINLEKYLFQTHEMLLTLWVKFEEPICRSIRELCQLFKVTDWTLSSLESGYKPFLQSNLDDARQFCLAIRKTIDRCGLDDNSEEYRTDMVSLINRFINASPVVNSAEFLNKSKYICEYFEKPFDSIKESLGYNFDSKRFDSLKNKINFNTSLINPNELKANFIFKKALKELNMDDALKGFKSSLYSVIEKQFVPNTPIVETSATSHYHFCGPVGIKDLKEEFYWQKASDITGIHFDLKNSVLMSKIGIVLIRPTFDCGIKFIIFNNCYNEDCVMGMMSVIKIIEEKTIAQC